MKYEPLVQVALEVLIVRLQDDGVQFRRSIDNTEIARAASLSVAEVGRVGRARERVYFDICDRQFRCEYRRGTWKIRHRARYW